MYCKLHKKHHQHRHYGCARKLPSPSSESSTSSDDLNSQTRAEVFRERAEEIKLNRSALLKKFPKEVWVPNTNDMEWCSFCLGSNICLEIYGEPTDGERAIYNRKLPYRRIPLLSIVLHLHQDKVKLLLRYLHQWFLEKGLKNVISMWLYALLACVDTQIVDDKYDRFLETLFKDLQKYVSSCEPWQKPRATIILAILEDYFSVDVSE